jgi:hypothetical protein
LLELGTGKTIDFYPVIVIIGGRFHGLRARISQQLLRLYEFKQ